MYQAGTKYILGIKPELEGLSINPCIPEEWDGFIAERKFRGNTYRISVENPDHVSRGIKSISVNGKTIDGNIIPADIDETKQVLSVRVMMG